jgi:two-component system OmpR family response regulator
MSKKIAIVEDDLDQRENYSDALRSEGYEVTAYADKDGALLGFSEDRPDLAILDVMLGDNHDAGFEICSELHRKYPTIPVIFLTARDSEVDRVEGLKLEAWDYLIKPITLEYLTVRVSSLFQIENRLTNQGEHFPTDNNSTFGELTINEISMTAHWQGKILDLTLTEFWLVEALAESAGEAFSYEALMPVTRQTIVEKNTINGHIRRIRIKFKRLDPEFNCIRNIFGVGYRWDC